ncbi:NPCBM/NEW2 domain-containing protein [Micromonospora sp. NPDC049048]|uniref:NPCBM/NEW2 domain-containing protein n=1 Tax=Micromonospora sp. NPDC049048 TaxID=3364263 RepID=UPI00371C5110
MPDADGTPGRRAPDHIWITVAVVADVSAVVATARSTLGVIVVVAGVGALLAGIYRIAVRWGQPVDWRIVLATVTMIAGSGALIVTIDRSLTSGPHSRDNAAAARDHGKAGGQRSADLANQNSANAPTPPPPSSSTSSPSQPPGTMSLLDAHKAAEGFLHFSESPLKVNGTTYDRTVHGTSTCQSDLISTTYQLDRRYRQFQAGVGVGDETPYPAKVRFTLWVDGAVKHSETAEFGEIVPFRADIAGAFRIAIQAEVLTTACGGLDRRVFAAWVDPVVTP